MKKLTGRIVEGTLRAWPRLCRALNDREAYLEALCRNKAERRFAGGERWPEQERVLLRKLNDRECRELMVATGRLWRASWELHEHDRVALWLVYLLGMDAKAAARQMGICERDIYRRLGRGRDGMADACLDAWRAVDRWL